MDAATGKWVLFTEEEVRARLVEALWKRGFECKELSLDTLDEYHVRYMFQFQMETEEGDTGPWEDHMAIECAGLREYANHACDSTIYVNMDREM